jgi:hypothetical protein
MTLHDFFRTPPFALLEPLLLPLLQYRQVVEKFQHHRLLTLGVPDGRFKFSFSSRKLEILCILEMRGERLGEGGKTGVLEEEGRDEVGIGLPPFAVFWLAVERLHYLYIKQWMEFDLN